jgi:NAD(P)-dependent dehydrogenase (short-subunit alcohol dehydrogenase family)
MKFYYSLVKFSQACSADSSLQNLEVIEMVTTKEESVNIAVASILIKEGHIDLVVNNAGMGYFGIAD